MLHWQLPVSRMCSWHQLQLEQKLQSFVMHGCCPGLHNIMTLASYVLLAHALLSLTSDPQDWFCRE